MPITVSPQWKEAVQGQFRLPAYLRANLMLVPPGLRENATAAADDRTECTTPDQMIDGVSSIREHAATLEPGRWPGDGSAYLPSKTPSENLETGWWSYLTNNPWSELTFTFDKGYEIPGVHIIWDTLLKAHPRKVKITGYAPGGIQIGVFQFDHPSSYAELFSTPMVNVAKVVIRFEGWSVSDQRSRVTEVTFGLAATFDNDDFNSAQLRASSDLLSGELPQLGVQLVLNNYDKMFDPTLKVGYAKYLAQRQLCNLSWGFEVAPGKVEWMEPWPLYLHSWNIPADAQTVTLSTTSRLTFLDQTYDKAPYDMSERTLLSVAKEVLQASNLIKNVDGETPWELDPVLDSVTTRAPLPNDAFNALLQLIANAAGCMLDINPENDYIRIRQTGDPADYTVGTMQQLGDPSFKIIDRLKSVTIGLHTYTAKSSSEKVYSFTGTLKGVVELDIQYDQNAAVTGPRVAVSGANLISANYYARGAHLRISASSSGAQVQITITGNVIEESVTWVQTYQDDAVNSGMEITIDNPLVTEMATVDLLAKAAKDMYLRQVEATVPYLGYPELETGDTVKFATNYGWLKGDLTGVSLDYNGGFTGQLNARMLNVGALDRAGKSDWYCGEIASGGVD